MTLDFTIAIADWLTRLAFDDSATEIAARVREQYRAFIVPAQPNIPTLYIRFTQGPLFIPRQPGDRWQINTALQNGQVKFQSHHEAGWMDRARGLGELELRPPLGHPENFLRVLYAWAALEHDALLLHSCGIIRNGCGYVFFGHSGSGKSTTAHLSLGHTILSDDMVIIRKDHGMFRVYGVPFRGDMPEAPRTNAVADLRAIFTLNQDTRHHIEPLAISEATARLASCVPFVMTNPVNIQRVLSISTELARQIPIRALHFKRDPGFWEVIDGLE